MAGGMGCLSYGMRIDAAGDEAEPVTQLYEKLTNHVTKGYVNQYLQPISLPKSEGEVVRNKNSSQRTFVASKKSNFNCDAGMERAL